MSGVIPREFYTSYSDLTVLVKAANHHGSATSTMAAFNTGDISESVRDDSSLYIPNSFRGTDMTLSVSVSLSHCLTDSLLCSFSPPTLTLSPTLSLSPAFSLALSFFHSPTLSSLPYPFLYQKSHPPLKSLTIALSLWRSTGFCSVMMIKAALTNSVRSSIAPRTSRAGLR